MNELLTGERGALSASELSYWLAYDLLEPFGSPAQDARAGTITAMLANVNRGKGQSPIKASDIFPSAQQRAAAMFRDDDSPSGIDSVEAADIAAIKAALK